MGKEQSKLGSPLILGIVGVALASALVVGYQFMPARIPTAPAANIKPDANADFYKEMALKCNGDMTKLSPQDQMAVIQKAGSGNYARQILADYANRK